jgi:hypothetical protein
LAPFCILFWAFSKPVRVSTAATYKYLSIQPSRVTKGRALNHLITHILPFCRGADIIDIHDSTTEVAAEAAASDVHHSTATDDATKTLFSAECSPKDATSDFDGVPVKTASIEARVGISSGGGNAYAAEMPRAGAINVEARTVDSTWITKQGSDGIEVHERLRNYKYRQQIPLLPPPVGEVGPRAAQSTTSDAPLVSFPVTSPIIMTAASEVGNPPGPGAAMVTSPISFLAQTEADSSICTSSATTEAANNGSNTDPVSSTEARSFACSVERSGTPSDKSLPHSSSADKGQLLPPRLHTPSPSPAPAPEGAHVPKDGLSNSALTAPNNHNRFDLVLSMSDDRTDEDLYNVWYERTAEAVVKRGGGRLWGFEPVIGEWNRHALFTVKVCGSGTRMPRNAKYSVEDPNEVFLVLKALADGEDALPEADSSNSVGQRLLEQEKGELE